MHPFGFRHASVIISSVCIVSVPLKYLEEENEVQVLCVAGTGPVMGVSKDEQQGSPNCFCPRHSFFFFSTTFFIVVCPLMVIG